ncbi:hypothetical protein O97_00747 [Bartonella henselae str. Zeus]|uniref:Uncharacterized protein n=1 Tax=Bartonella henselae TaxID=38323 RepID=X5MGC0_BARHN|nr:hypothetical protein Q653_01278 [Bartonella henselae JK 42]ETS16428.1 hypothetical protein Q652_00112 [Bartonella henselae JK 41]KEC57712.1 hypothetical protein O97_00747 [Bartonella henselae str. Zeus]KEC62966.1 hypothetical protein O95_00575 [Bartonella henselae JK 53]CDO46295.1 hypothetical protein BM1374165_00271 [Bartonella henselae]
MFKWIHSKKINTQQVQSKFGLCGKMLRLSHYGDHKLDWVTKQEL